MSATPTDTEVLTALKTALKGIAAGRAQSVRMPNGEMVQFLNVRELQEMINVYEAKVDAAASEDGAFVDVQLGGHRHI